MGRQHVKQISTGKQIASKSQQRFLSGGFIKISIKKNPPCHIYPAMRKVKGKRGASSFSLYHAYAKVHRQALRGAHANSMGKELHGNVIDAASCSSRWIYLPTSIPLSSSGICIITHMQMNCYRFLDEILRREEFL